MMLLSMTVVYTSSELGNTALKKKTLESLNVADRDMHGLIVMNVRFQFLPSIIYGDT